MIQRTKMKLEVPDGGWGWMVVLGVAATNMFNQSLISLFGLIFGEELENMGHGTSGAAFVMNSMSVVTNFSGFITGPVIKKYSYRKVAITGSLLTSIGLILSSQATSLWQIFLSYSIISGLGLGLIAPSSFVAVNTYFSKRRGRAVGMAMAGTGLGQMLMPHVVRILLDEYGYRGTTLIIGGLALNGVVGSSLFQPINWHMKTIDEHVLLLKDNEKIVNFSTSNKSEKYQNNNASKNVVIALQHSSTNDTKVEVERSISIDSPSKALISRQTSEAKPSLWQRFVTILDLNLLKDPIFLSITFGLSIVYSAGIYFSMLFPFFLQEGPPRLSRGETATCMSVLAGADIVSRLTLPMLTYKLGIGARTTFFFGTFALAFARSSIAFQDEYVMIIICSLITGYIRAGTVVNQNLTISEYCSQDQLPYALGLNMVNKGLVVITLGQFLGWLRDYSGSFQISIYVSNLFLIFVFIMWLPEMCWKAIKK
ncbi:monocarboxylate transporter 12-B-like [Chrysoperla carnea]|uniref:monocarboxylate transporter 12-B-like n=1 Tax=Chrysoperla carnea TaxID=189513 RepID=UPI001D080873|nr:monocarboxylate transporter 12-B-like [Chrysoperla carnea]